MVNVIDRAVWGARRADGSAPAQVPYEGIYLHHSVTVAPDLVAPFDDEHRAMRTLEDIGQQRFRYGISYTWGGMPTGNVYEGHSVGRRGAHTGGMNTVVRALVLVGNYSSNPPTAALIQSAGELVRQEHQSGRSKSRTLLGGHRDANKKMRRPATSCPGDAAYAAIARINAVALGATAQPTYVVPALKPAARPAPATAGDFIPYDFPLKPGHWFGPLRKDEPRNHSGTGNRTDQGHIRAFQQGFARRGWNIAADGIYGPKTRETVAKFQTEKGLAVDGRCGAATWSAIDRSPRT